MKCVLARLLPMGVALLSIGVAAGSARAQTPLPRFPDVNHRSGLVTRFSPMLEPTLPPDRDRDTFWGTRYGDYPLNDGSNSPKDGGLYGQPLNPGCTECRYPYFRGAPGGNARCAHCQPSHPRGIGSFLYGVTHRARGYKPVEYYYSNGCYVPVYDLDPWVPGPGPDLWRHFIQGAKGG